MVRFFLNRKKGWNNPHKVYGTKSKKFLANLSLLNRKKGWTKVLEVFFAIVLLASVLAIMMESGALEDNSREQEIDSMQGAALRSVQLNDSLRNDVLGPGSNKRVNSTLNEMVRGLKCKARVCGLGSDCLLNKEISGDVYARSSIIFANQTQYSPKNLKVFCWED